MTAARSFFASRTLGWRVQLNLRHALNDDDIETLRASLAGGGLDWGRVEPRPVMLGTTLTF